MIQTIPATRSPIRVALVEPCEADARWFSMALSGLCLPATVTRYSTGISALESWTHDPSANFDVVVVAAVLPMLSLQEFVDAARTIFPNVLIVVAGAQLVGGPPPEASVPCLTKPVSSADIHLLHATVAKCQSHRIQPEELSGVSDVSTARTIPVQPPSFLATTA